RPAAGPRGLRRLAGRLGRPERRRELASGAAAGAGDPVGGAAPLAWHPAWRGRIRAAADRWRGEGDRQRGMPDARAAGRAAAGSPAGLGERARAGGRREPDRPAAADRRARRIGARPRAGDRRSGGGVATWSSARNAGTATSTRPNSAANAGGT